MSEQQPPEHANRIAIHVDQETEQGSYANFMTILHTNSEFMLDFGMFLPGKNTVRIKDRIIVSPGHVKDFLVALQDNIAKYEAIHGPIQRASERVRQFRQPEDERIN